MRRASTLLPVLLLAGSLTPTVLLAADKDRLADAPAPPFSRLPTSPRLAMVAGSQVQIVDDARVPDDEFRYGVFWYDYRDGWWYRARHWNGPFAAIEPRDVPRAIITVPPGRWKHLTPVAPELTARPTAAWVAEKERRIHGIHNGKQMASRVTGSRATVR
jgi:hypothetical protein